MRKHKRRLYKKLYLVTIFNDLRRKLKEIYKNFDYTAELIEAASGDRFFNSVCELIQGDCKMT